MPSNGDLSSTDPRTEISSHMSQVVASPIMQLRRDSESRREKYSESASRQHNKSLAWQALHNALSAELERLQTLEGIS